MATSAIACNSAAFDPERARSMFGAQVRVEEVPQEIDKQIDGDDKHDEEHRWNPQDPPLAGQKVLHPDPDQRAKRPRIRRQPDAEKGQRRFEQDQCRGPDRRCQAGTGGTALCPDRRQQTVDQRERAKIIRIRRRDPRRRVAPATIVTLTTTARIASGLRENSQTFVYTRVSLIG